MESSSGTYADISEEAVGFYSEHHRLDTEHAKYKRIIDVAFGIPVSSEAPTPDYTVTAPVGRLSETYTLRTKAYAAVKDQVSASSQHYYANQAAYVEAAIQDAAGYNIVL